MSTEPLLSTPLHGAERASNSEPPLEEAWEPNKQPSRQLNLSSSIFWILGPWIIGAVLALAIPSSSNLPEPTKSFSKVFGWCYFSAWSLSFYPQIWTNYRRRSVVGLSLDFQVLNLLGFLCYSIYNISLRYIPIVREQYAALHDGQPPAVHANDVFFAVHATAATVVTLVQCCIYERGGARPHLLSSVISTALAVFAAAWAAAIALLPTVIPEACPDACPPSALLTWLSWLYFLSYIKLGITLVKYVPQVVLNCKRGSTEGWSVWNVLLDVEGGVLSLSQLIMDASVCSDWTPVTGNPVKFALGWTSMVFDAVFIRQHYCFYVPASEKGSKRSDLERDGVEHGAGARVAR